MTADAGGHAARPRRFALLLSLAVILAAWGWALWRQLGPGEAPAPGSVRELTLFVTVRAVVVLALVVALLRANGERLADLGFGARPVRESWLRGLLLAAGLFVLINIVLNSALQALGVPGKPEAVPALFRDPREAPLWVWIAVVGGGFTEELQRAFVITRFERQWGRTGLVLGIAADSVMFGLGHSYQGLLAMIGCGLSGLLYALIFLRRRRVADAMAAHAGFDLLSAAAAYALYGRGG